MVLIILQASRFHGKHMLPKCEERSLFPSSALLLGSGDSQSNQCAYTGQLEASPFLPDMPFLALMSSASRHYASSRAAMLPPTAECAVLSAQYAPLLCPVNSPLLQNSGHPASGKLFLRLQTGQIPHKCMYNSFPVRNTSLL